MPATWEVEDKQNLDTGSTAPSVRVVVPPVSSAAASHVQPAFENNNPGNLEYRGQPGATQNGRYAQFARPEDGYQAMQGQIDLDSKRGSTLGDYIRKYAPLNENDTETYTRNAEAATGANRNIPLAKVDHDKLAAFQAKQESGASVWDVAPDSPYQPGSPAAASGWEVAADSPFQPGTPATPSAAPAQGVIPGMEALGGTPPGIPRPPAPAGLQNQPAAISSGDPRAANQPPWPPTSTPAGPLAPGAVAVGSPQILAEQPPPKPVGPAFVTPYHATQPIAPAPGERQSDQPGVAQWTENLVNAARTGSVGPVLKAAFASPVDMKAVDDELSNYLIGPFAIQKGIIESAVAAGTSPGNLALMGGIGGAAKLAAAAPSAYIRAAWETADTALSAYFAGTTGVAAAKDGKAAWDAIQKGDWEDAAKNLGFATVDGLFAYLGARNAISKGLDIKNGIQEGIQLGKIKQALQDELDRKEAQRRADERAGLEPKQLEAPAPEAPPPTPAGELPPGGGAPSLSAAPGWEVAPDSPFQPPAAPAAETQPNATERQPAAAQPPQIAPGAEFQIGSRKYSVQKIGDEDNPKVTYSIEGATQKPVTLTKPLSVFQAIVSAGVSPVSSTSPATEPSQNKPGVQTASEAEPGATPAVSLPAPSLPSGAPEFTVSPEQYTARYDRAVQTFSTDHPEWSQTQVQSAAHNWAASGTVTGAPGSAAQPSAAQTPVEQQKERTATESLVKPKPTDQQTEDIITGTLNPPLTPSGKADAEKRAQDTQNVTAINAGPMARTQETAQLASQASANQVPVTTKPALGPWDLGDYQGKPQSEVDDQINHFIAHPDEVVPGGTSYNAYKNPLIGEIQQQVADWKPGDRILNSTHSIGVQTVQAWVANGAPADRSINLEAMLNRQKLEPTSLLRIDPRTMKASFVENTKGDGIFLERHADTPLDNVQHKVESKAVSAVGGAGEKSTPTKQPQTPEGATRYVRFGKPPESGKSTNYRDRSEESGVSAHRIIFHNGQWFLDEGGQGFTTAFDDRPQYEIQGDVVGTGSDGEPLVRVSSSKKASLDIRQLPTIYQSKSLPNSPTMQVYRHRISGQLKANFSNFPELYRWLPKAELLSRLRNQGYGSLADQVENLYPESESAAHHPSGAEQILGTIQRLEQTRGVPISTLRLRAALPQLSKEEFDRAALELRQKQQVFLSQHVDTYNISDADRHMLVEGPYEKRSEDFNPANWKASGGDSAPHHQHSYYSAISERPNAHGEYAPAQAPSVAETSVRQQNETTAQPAVGEVHKYSTTQVNLPEALAKVARAWSAKIPAKSLAEDGREAESHVTLKYGLHDIDPSAAIQALAGEGPVKVKLGAISIFKGAGPDDPDVLKLDVKSPDLTRLNAKVSKLPNSDEHPKYSPHLTLAYVKRGMGDKYVGKIIPGLSGKTISLDTVTFSAKDGTRTEIPLSGVEMEAGAKPTVSRPTPSLPSAKEGPIPSGHFMNEGDIEQALEKFKDHPILSRATTFLRDLMDETNTHSDGWPYWKLPIHAAAQLQGMIQHPEYASEDNLKKAIAPIRSFYTRAGFKAGMKFPEAAGVQPMGGKPVTAPESQIARKPEAIADRIKQEWAAEPDWYQDIAGKRPPWSDVVDAYGKFRADHPTGYQQHIKDFAVDFVEGTGNAQWYRTAETTPSPLAPQLQGGAEPQQPKQTLVLKPSTEEPIQQVEPSKIKEPESKSEPITRAGENQEALAEVPSNNVQPVGEEREAREGVEERGQPDEGSLRTSDRTGTSSRSSQGTDQGAVGVPSGRETNAGTRGTIPSPESRLGSGTDYRITDADQIGTGSVKEKASGNLDAIRTLKQIEADGRIATPDEQKILAKYVGWGGMPQLFKESYYVQPEWQGIRAELDGLLTPDEFTSAAASTPNAHYTSPTVIKGMWDAADRLGLLPKDGLITVLEPSMGVGSFFGLMPEGTEASRVGVELDSITGRIAKALYPQSDVHVAGFEKVRLPNDYFDLAISNVPFGNYPVFDPQYKRTPGVTRSIHDYFFAKALDKVRPGGVVAFITSSYTMDKQDPFMRDYLAARADLVGAIRLPNTAFKASAGTEVTTDIIFLQKRAQEAAPSGEAWTQLKPITGERKRPDGSMGPVEMQVNEYYAAHPEMMLGKMGLLGSQYRDESAALTGNLTPEKLAEAVNRLPENIVSAWKAPVEAFDSVSSIPASGELKDGGYTVQDGKVLVRVGDQLRPTDLSGQQLRSVSGQIKVRDAVHEVFRTQLAGDSEKSIAEAMKKLNTAYDAFVRNNGPLHKKENAKAFADDPDAPVLLALEDWDKETQKAKKADIFSKRVIDTTKPATSADNAKDALSLSLNELGRLDWARMQELTGRTPKELQDELGPLVYQNPSGKAWLPADEYLSGNVRRKLADAEAAAQIDRKFQRNVEALKAVQPIELLPGQIKARLGSSWIPKQEIQQFVSELLDLPLRAVTVGHSEGLGSWTLSLSQKDTVANNRTWGTNRFRGSDLIDDALNLRSPTAYDASKDANGNDIRVINDKETLAAREMQKQIKDKFSEWTWTDPDRSSRLAQIYNEELNSDRLWQPDGSHLTFPGMNLGLKLRPHQKNGVWRIVRGDGNVLLAHVVGSGKTLEIVAGAMELRRLGKSKKPMAVVPNNRVAGTAEEWLRAYPSANILTIGGEDFTPDQRQQMMARIATGNWDGVIVSGEAFTKVPVSDETFNSFLQAQIREYEGFIRDAKADKSDTKIVKELEKAKKRMEAKIRTKNDDVRRDRAISFEDLGVDSLFVDEADLYKNLQFPTKMTRISGIPNTESQRAFDMYLKTQYLTQRNNGRGVIFATGTPVANSMAEVWTMQRYLQPQYLKEHGLQHFDSWAQTFGEVNPALEMTPDGSGVRVTNKFNKFVNMPELIKGFHQVADVQTAKMLQLPVPKLKGGRPTIVSAKASPAQQAYLKTLAERAKKVKGKKPQKGADNILVIGTDGQKAAVDIRLVDPSQPDHPGSKVNMAVDRIVDTWKKTAEKKSTQIVFLDMSTPQPKGRAKGGFSVYEDMRDKLLRRGIPKNEIAFIQDYKGDEPKEELFAAMNAGKVRVLFGSTQAAGVGVNVQKKLIAQHQLDAPYRPRDVEQREGRILRQGNENPEIEIIRYVTEPSFDARKWDILTGKASYINAFMEGDMTVREMEDISDAELSYGEIAAIASGNPAIREKVMVDTEIRKLDAMRSRYEQQEFAIKRDLQALPGTIKADHLEAKKAQKDLDTRDSSPNEFMIGKKTFKGEDGRKNASAALEALLNTRFNEKGTEFGSQTFAIGNYRGFRLVGIDYTSTDGVRREADILIQGELTYRSLNPSPGTAIQSIEGKVRNIEGVRDNWAHSAKESEKKLADTKAIAGKSFDQGDKLKTLLARQAELEKILQTKEPDASAVGGDTDENADGEIETPGDLAELKAKTLTSSLHGSENGPISEYKPGRGTLKAPERAGGSIKEGWLTSEDEGRPIYSNGHILLEGKAPGPETDTSPAFAKSMRDYLHPETAPQPVTPVAYGAPAEKGAAKSIWLSDGTAVDAKYYDHVLKQYPAATFAVGEVKKSGKVIYAQLDGRNIGIVMPLNFPKGAPDAVKPFLNPMPKEEAQADARDVADQRAEGKERGSFSQVTSYEKDARLRKAVALAEALDAADATPSQAREMTDAQWKMAAELATARAREKNSDAPQVYPPHSDATKKEVIGHLKLIQGIRANAGERGSIASDILTLGVRSTPKALGTVAAVPDLQALGAKSNAVQALQSALEEESDKNFGEKLRTFVTGERDIRIAETNQLRDKLKKLIPNSVEQEALSLMRDFKHKEDELVDFSIGEHELFKDMDPEDRKEAYARMRKIMPAVQAALAPTPQMLEADRELTKYFTEHLAEGRKLGFLDSSISNDEYITHLLQPAELSQKPSLKDRIFRSGKLGPRKFKFAKGRFYPTVLHAVASGLGLRTLNALDALTIYGDKYATTAAYHLFLRAVKDSGAGKWGTYSQQKAGKIPSDWTELAPESRIFRNDVPFINPEGEADIAHQNLYVPSKIEMAMRPIFDPNYMSRVPGFQAGRAYQAYIKAVELGLSVFHLKALNLTGLGNEGLSGLVGTYISDMKSPEFLDAEKSWIRAGLTTPVLGRAVEAYQALTPSSLPTTAENIRSLPGLKQVDQAAAAITHLTFGIVQRKLKVTDASLKYAKWIEHHPTATPAEAFEAQRLISKEINAAYGGLHWENLGVNRVTQELSRALMLAPDWTFSNIFNVGQSFTGGPGGNAARLFWIRSIILGLALTAGMSILMSGKRGQDPTRVRLGRDRKGKDLDDNMFFVGAPGDVSTLVHDVSKYGVVVGLARLIGNKLGPFARAGVHLMTNTDQMGRPIIPKTANTNLLGQRTRSHQPGFLEKTGLGAEQLARDVMPVPFSVSTLARMILDKNHKYTVGQYAESVISGRQPSAIAAGAR